MVSEGLRILRNTSFYSKKDVIKQQISPMGLTIVGEKKYKMYTAIRVFEYVSLSSLCYNRLRQDFQLASMKKLTRLTSSVEICDMLIKKLRVTSYELISLRVSFIARVTSYRLFLLCQLRVIFCMRVTSYCLLYELRVILFCTSYEFLFLARVTSYFLYASYEL